ncbi:MAG: hypothetical protein ACRCZP_11675 [Phycicoccus sp.]
MPRRFLNGVDPQDVEPAVRCPQDHAFKSWAYDPVSIAASTVLTAGTLNLVKLHTRLPRASISQVWVNVATAGATLTNVGFVIVSAAGTVLTSSVNANGATAAAFQTTGVKNVTFTATGLPGTNEAFWVGFWTTGTTQPAISRASTIANVYNINAAAGAARFASGSTGLTTTAPGTTAFTPNSNTFWAAAA